MKKFLTRILSLVLCLSFELMLVSCNTTPNEENMIPADYVGLVSAHTEKKKIEKSGFTVIKSNLIDAPIIEELPLTLECELDYIDEKSGCVYGKIVNVIADDKVLDESGNADLNKLNPISYDPASRSYFTMGEKVGKAFSIGQN